jgi:hypothetical protein
MTVELFPGTFAANWSKISKFLQEEPARFPNMLYHNINITADRQAGLEESKRFLYQYYGPVFSPPMVEAWTVAGDTIRWADDLQRFRDQGRSSSGTSPSTQLREQRHLRRDVCQ